jgi:hypothetical protein
MTGKEATTRFIYGSKEINKMAEYENDYSIELSAGENHFCNNNCYDCEMVCPYKEY